MGFHVDVFPEETYPFKFQQFSLEKRAASYGEGINKDPASRPHNSLPGQALWTAVHSPTDLSRHVRCPNERSDLSVG